LLNFYSYVPIAMFL